MVLCLSLSGVNIDPTGNVGYLRDFAKTLVMNLPETADATKPVTIPIGIILRNCRLEYPFFLLCRLLIPTFLNYLHTTMRNLGQLYLRVLAVIKVNCVVFQKYLISQSMED